MNIIISELIWPNGIEALQEKNWNVVYDPELWKDPIRLTELAKSADALIIRNQTRITRELLSQCSNLKVLGRLGVGMDNIDLQAAEEAKVVVVYGKNANATSVAEYVISSIFDCTRQLREASTDVKEGNWNRKLFTGNEISGKTLGLIGVGEISHRVAVRARAMGMRVMGYDPFVSSYDFPVAESGVQLVGLQRLYEESDFISIHVPLIAQTRHLINGSALEQMKASAYLINSSRGGVVDEMDLANALANRIIAGAVLDVLEQEPPDPEHPLLKERACILTPHIAGLTEESQIRTSEMVAREVIRELEGSASLCRYTGR